MYYQKGCISSWTRINTASSLVAFSTSHFINPLFGLSYTSSKTLSHLSKVLLFNYPSNNGNHDVVTPPTDDDLYAGY